MIIIITEILQRGCVPGVFIGVWEQQIARQYNSVSQ